ncbi:hypothetical protein HOT82_gp114 [Gordonia phage Ronaldo]|uniref:Uncharacterized protein n=4 Tax=Ronaldovirus TaxID=2733205 RepID=A0A6B9L8Z2_9CAUD|nr:hypothetical protein HOT81_gp112 [Gordonia phage Fryberger]YP_009807810.1 hypothetical protein HOT82_gp114 [Gordonia phage Ronaldo]QDH48453.1 hypothetical protein SEA_ZIKO_115 [Gordonia phage Ziko]QHB38230.1 hypothetical protein SEA_VOLT_116 [Gordonia phage Volt]QTF81900.1 hypothetical protein SEA_GUEY18_117 [Gordonia phage Guey18]AXN53528.1 hypothetical protein SEA_FRYBERGER_112 [Gordonia phage Fryberger]AXN53676.1 hypothetical protein SEA_RONALDO_114 [Gordonia phage Ronaldo]
MPKTTEKITRFICDRCCYDTYETPLSSADLKLDDSSMTEDGVWLGGLNEYWLCGACLQEFYSWMEAYETEAE